MANSFNGIGTSYYGQSKFEQDGSYVTTKWFILGFLPIIPMASARVNYVGTSGIPFFSRTSSFELVEELPIDWLQVLKTWLYTIFIIALVSGVMTSNKPPAFRLFQSQGYSADTERARAPDRADEWTARTAVCG